MSAPAQTSPLALSTAASGLIPVAAYIRMSTEHPQYSTEHQLDRMKEFAIHRGMEITRVFADEGKSGLSVRGREGLRRLIAEVEAGQAGFKCILAYDVSRWGRFQDADESGYYEYLCKRAGITVHYCAEQFENDGSPASNIIKSVKRSMAGEYSRELSTKVFQGACRLIQLGFKQGGAAGFGLRRMLIDQSGARKGTLKAGEQKSLQTDRVVLVPGPEDEQAVVRQIYRAFVQEGKSEREIAASLNGRKILTDLGRPWTRGTVHQVLTNEKYIGNNLYHRTSFKLKRKHVANPPELWIRSDGAFPGIVEITLFAQAQEIVLSRARRFTDEEMLRALKDLWTRHGRISGLLIDEQEGLPSSAAFRHRFGSHSTRLAELGLPVRQAQGPEQSRVDSWPAAGILDGVNALIVEARRMAPSLSRGMPVVYFLCLRSGIVYIGVSTDLEQRLKDHLTGQACRTTALDPPQSLLRIETYASFAEARRRESQLKRWSRGKKQALVHGDMARLRTLSRSQK